MQFQPPIIVTAASRSGSSMIAGLLNVCGAFVSPKTTDKMYENVTIREQVILPYLVSIGADPLGQYPLPSTNRLPIPTDLANHVFQIMKEEGYRGGPWVLKSSKILLTWPIWNYAFPTAKWVIVRRRTGDIINSCLHTDYMKAFKTPETCQLVGAKTEIEGWKWWVNQHTKRMYDLITSGINCQVVWPERLVTGDYSQVFDLVDWLGLKWTQDCFAFIEPKLFKSRKKENVFRPPKEVNNGSDNS